MIAFLEKAKSEISSGTVTEEEYWCVPKTNFPNGLPDAIKEFVEDPNALESMQLHAGCSAVPSFDSANFYIVDKAISRTSLGKDVKIRKSQIDF